MTTRVAIDLNVRIRGNQTYAGLEDVTGPLAIGSNVEVFEPETGLAGPAEVTEVDHDRQLVYLAVNWAKLREPSMPASPTTWIETVIQRLRVLLREWHQTRESSRMARR